MKNRLTTMQASCISVLYFSCGFTLIGQYNTSGFSTWLAILSAAVVSLVLLLFYSALSKFLVKSKLLSLLFGLLALCLAAFYIYLVVRFFQICLLPSVSIFVTGGLLLFFSLWFGLHGLTVLGRFSKLLLPFLGALLLLLLLIPLPAVKPLYVDSILSLPDLRVGIPLFLFAYLLKGILLIHILRLSGSETLSPARVIRNGILVSAPLMAGIHLSALFTLGSSLFGLLNYPVFYPLGLMEAGEYIQHFEIFFLILCVFSELVHIGLFFAAVRMLLGNLKQKSRATD